MAAILATVLLVGCDSEQTNLESRVELPPLPPLLRGTVAEHARLLDAGEMPVTGYGLVIGLGDKGSTEVPPRLRTYMTKYLARMGFGWWRQHTQDVSPMVILRDPDTAIVEVRGRVPSGAPKGAVFDVEVQAISSDVVSLNGGVLMPMELHQHRPGVDVALHNTQTWGEALGPVYINPFIDPSDPKNQSKLLQGRVVGGGEVTRGRLVHLQMLGVGEYAWASFLQRKINERFSSRLTPKVATAQDASLIEVTVPVQRRQDYQHFLQLVQHLPVRGDLERYAKELAQKLATDSEADAETVAILLEAVGRKSIPFVRPLYGAEDDRAAFYAARVGLRLGDSDQACMVLGALAQQEDSPYRLGALKELGRSREIHSQIGMLRRQLDDPDAQVRLLAYSALLNMGDPIKIDRYELPDQIYLDVVESSGPYTIFAASTLEPRIVVFGEGLRLAPNVYLEMPNETLIVDAKPGRKRVKAWRKVPRKDSYTDVNTSSRGIVDFIQMIASTPQRQAMQIERVDPESGEVITDTVVEHRGLSLTYSQVLAVLHRLCDQKYLPATFVLR
jgi:hypothetical protein